MQEVFSGEEVFSIEQEVLPAHGLTGLSLRGSKGVHDGRILRIILQRTRSKQTQGWKKNSLF